MIEATRVVVFVAVFLCLAGSFRDLESTLRAMHRGASESNAVARFFLRLPGGEAIYILLNVGYAILCIYGARVIVGQLSLSSGMVAAMAYCFVMVLVGYGRFRYASMNDKAAR